MAKKEKSKTGAKKKPVTGKKTARTVTPARKVQGKKQVPKKKVTQKKTAAKKTGKVSRPAKKPVRKKVGGQTPKTKTTAQRLAQKKRPAKVPATKVSRRTPSQASHTAAAPLSPRKELLRKHLISKREEIVREAKEEIAKYIKGDSSQMVETALDDGDWSVIDLSADINIRRLETHRERLLGIDEALMKLREGTYGVCEECGGEITAERLKVMPFAVYCRDCQEKKEQIEKIAREEIIT